MLEYLRIYRPLNLLFIGAAQILAAYFLYFDASFGNLYDAGLHWLVLGTAAVAALGYWLNDYFDYKRDQINQRRRFNVRSLPIPLLVVHLLVFLLAVFHSANQLNVLISMTFVASLLVLLLYNWKLKDLAFIGNILIAVLSFLSVFMVGWLFPEIDRKLLLHYAFLAAMLNFCRELIKDAEDMEGDKATGAQTMPVLWGLQTTNRVVYFSILFVVSFVIISLYYQQQYFKGALLYLYWAYYILFVILPLYNIALNVRNVQEKSQYSKMSKEVKYVLFTGILSILFF